MELHQRPKPGGSPNASETTRPKSSPCSEPISSMRRSVATSPGSSVRRRNFIQAYPRSNGVPAVPGFRLEPRADALPVPVAVLAAGVAACQAIDVREVGIVLDANDVPHERDLPVPLLEVDDSERC